MGTDTRRGRLVRTFDLYRFYNHNDRLLYIGISLSTVKRMNKHRDTQPWWPQVARMDVAHLTTITRADAEKVERQAIIDEQPLHNIIWNGRNPTRHLASASTTKHQPWTCGQCDQRIPLGQRQGFVQLDGWDLWICVCVTCDKTNAAHNGEHDGTYSRYWIDTQRLANLEDIRRTSEHLTSKQWFIPGEWTAMLRGHCHIVDAWGVALVATRQTA